MPQKIKESRFKVASFKRFLDPEFLVVEGCYMDQIIQKWIK